MFRRATLCPKLPRLWRGQPSTCRATSQRFAATRPQVPHPRNFFAGSIKYNMDSATSMLYETGLSLDPIRSRMTCPDFTDSVWGFVVYRCAGTDENAWKRMIQYIYDSINETLKNYGQEDLLPHHDLHVVDGRPFTSSQDSHHDIALKVRDHFNSWVTKSLAGRLPRNSATKLDDLRWNNATSTPRYEYCLFVDSLCLESLDHMYLPVVKILDRYWTDYLSPEERQSAVVYPGYHDGITDDWEEDVGWMYLTATEYVERYAQLHTDLGWDVPYVRAPYVTGFETEEGLVGAWRPGFVSPVPKCDEE